MTVCLYDRERQSVFRRIDLYKQKSVGFIDNYRTHCTCVMNGLDIVFFPRGRWCWKWIVQNENVMITIFPNS
mgnify:FL=1